MKNITDEFEIELDEDVESLASTKTLNFIEETKFKDKRDSKKIKKFKTDKKIYSNK